jgi:hypothetical protein
MDENPYRAPQEKPAAGNQRIGLLVFLLFLVLPILTLVAWIAYRIAYYGLFPAQH